LAKDGKNNAEIALKAALSTLDEAIMNTIKCAEKILELQK
jgi:hypothetical protein